MPGQRNNRVATTRHGTCEQNKYRIFLSLAICGWVLCLLYPCTFSDSPAQVRWQGLSLHRGCRRLRLDQAGSFRAQRMRYARALRWAAVQLLAVSGQGLAL